MLDEGRRFAAALREHDVTLADAPVTCGDGSIRIARTRAGGEYRLVSGSADRDGVWLDDSEGGLHFIAPDVRTWLEQIGQGYTAGDRIAGRATPSHQPLPGVLRWVASLPPVSPA